MGSSPQMAPGRRKVRPWLLWSVVVLLVLAVVAGIVVPRLLQDWISRSAEQRPPITELGAIVSAATTYAGAYENGYPASLVALGPPAEGAEPDCNAAGMLDGQLAGGRKYGYVFDYRPGPPISDAPEGCLPGAESFTLSARPLAYDKPYRGSLLTDELGVIHYTSEDRAATAADPPL